MAQNKGLDGKGTSTSAGQQKTTSQASGYKPRFHKTTAFIATAGGPDDEACCPQDSLPYEDTDSPEVEPSHKEDEGLYIPNYLEEAIPDDPVLQVRVARALRVQEINSRRCFTCNRPGTGSSGMGRKKWDQAPPAEGASSKQVGPGEGQAKSLSAQLAGASCRVERVPYLNPDAFSRFIGPKNWGQALINDELTTCLLDNGAQLNFITPAYAVKRGMDIMSLDWLAQEIGGQLPLIKGMGGSLVEPIGFVLMNVKVPCVWGYDEDQVALVMDDPEMSECPVILGTSTLYRVMEVIKESEISKLDVPWSSSQISWLMWDVTAKLDQVVVNDVANKPIAPLDVDEVVRVASKCTVPPFGHKVIHGKVNLVLHGCRLNVITHGLEKRSPSLPLGIDVQTAYATLANGSHRVPVVLRNNAQDWLKIKKGVPIARMVTANAIPKVTHVLPAEKPHKQPTLTEAKRQELLLEKLDLTGLEAWPKEQAEKARSLLKEYHDIFSLEKHDMGHTKATKHKIVLKDPDTPPFKERFRRIPPSQLDEVCAHLKMMLDAGVIRPSNSPWCNAVVLVRKKDGSLRFCIDFRRLNTLTVKDSHPLPRICETLESLAGVAHYSTIDMNSGFWQVPMDEASKQYTASTLGSMGLYECESMPFGLCNALPTFQRLMLNCLGELNLTYCLIYLDDVIILSQTEEEHLERMRVVFDRFREHGLKLKPSKCEVFKTEINYLAHHVSKREVLPSKKNLEAIAQCPPPDTYTKVKSFVGLVGHYRHFIKGFTNIATPLYDLTSGENKDKKSEHLDLPQEAREAFDRLKAACLQAPILAFPDFDKTFLLETDASGKGLGAVLLQKQSDGRYHPIAYASCIMNETEQRYHSNKQEFLALKWAVTEQFHEYLSPYGKNRNEFVVRTDNNLLTYIFSSANLDAAGQRWVAQLASYNFALEYQKGKDNTVANFLSRLDDRLPTGEVQAYLNKIPYPGVKAVLDNAITPLTDRAEQGVRPNPNNQKASQEVTIGARPARLATTNITDWKLEQQEDPVLYQVVKHRKASQETFKEALLKVTDRKAVSAYAKSKDQLIMRNGLLYRQSKQGQTQETVLQFFVPQIHRNAALDGCHCEAAHQGQSHSLSLMQE